MAYVVMAHIVMACIVMAYTFMAGRYLGSSTQRFSATAGRKRILFFFGRPGSNTYFPARPADGFGARSNRTDGCGSIGACRMPHACARVSLPTPNLAQACRLATGMQRNDVPLRPACVIDDGSRCAADAQPADRRRNQVNHACARRRSPIWTHTPFRLAGRARVYCSEHADGWDGSRRTIARSWRAACEGRTAAGVRCRVMPVKPKRTALWP